MLDKQGAGNDEAIPNGTSHRAERDAVVAQAVKPELTDPPSQRDAPPNHRKRKLTTAVLGAVVLAAALIFGVSWIRLALNTVSTDDAYVNGHVTFVAARVGGQVARVLVDDNNRVHKGAPRQAPGRPLPHKPPTRRRPGAVARSCRTAALRAPIAAWVSLSLHAPLNAPRSFSCS
jgi:hypothetical protein